MSRDNLKSLLGLIVILFLLAILFNARDGASKERVHQAVETRRAK